MFLSWQYREKGFIVMKILVYRWDIYPYGNIIDTLKKQGHQADVLAFPISNHIWDERFAPMLEGRLAGNSYDLVFSVNFYAVIAEICFRENIKYLSWTCDTPLLSMLHPSVNYPTSYIFTFDRAEYKHFKKQGLPHIYYLPLAGTNHDFGIRQLHSPKTAASNADGNSPRNGLSAPDYLYDISFVGSLYEKNRYEEMCLALPEKLRGYLDAIVEAGRHFSGGDFISRMLTGEILSEVSRYVSVEGEGLSDEALRIHFETAVVSYKIAADTRLDALWLLSQKYRTDLFTSTPANDSTIVELDASENISIHPPVDYQQEMPEIFRRSKINLNFTIPNITDGVPLRVFDVLSSGGFLLTDRRESLGGLFQEGKDLVVFDGMGDLIEKTGYYLDHPREREQIARRGMEKVRSLHTYDRRIREMFSTTLHD